MNRSQLLLEAVKSLTSYQPQKTSPQGLRTSAVLIPIQLGDHPRILYTKRSQQLKHHPGQVSFPGGRLEPGEKGWDAALREAYEEIGLPPGHVEYVTRLDDSRSPRGFHIQCYIGITAHFEPRLNPAEVDALIPVPLTELCESQRHRKEPWQRDPRIHVHYFEFTPATVWGVTGLITYRLRELIQSRLKG